MKKFVFAFVFMASFGQGDPFGLAHSLSPPQRGSHDTNLEGTSSAIVGKATNKKGMSRLGSSARSTATPFSRLGASSSKQTHHPSTPTTNSRCSSQVFGLYPMITPQYAAVSLVSKLLSRKRQEGQESSVARTTTVLRGGAGILSATGSAIPVSSWLVPALLCATAYALYNIFIKKSASHNMDPILGGVILQFVAALMGSVLYLGKRGVSVTSSVPNTTNMIMISRQGIQWSMAAGVAVGAAELLSFIVSGKGVPATHSIPIIVGGSIVVGTILGSVWLQEQLSVKGWIGVALIALGIVLVGMDPSHGILGH